MVLDSHERAFFKTLLVGLSAEVLGLAIVCASGPWGKDPAKAMLGWSYATLCTAVFCISVAGGLWCTTRAAWKFRYRPALTSLVLSLLIGTASFTAAFIVLISMSFASMFGSPANEVVNAKVRIREIFKLPPEAEETHFTYTAPQREIMNAPMHIEVLAAYRLSPELLETLTSEWHPLPIPETLRDYRNLEAPRHAHGRYLCRTNGSDILYASTTTSCDDKKFLPDVIFAVADPGASMLWVRVASLTY